MQQTSKAQPTVPPHAGDIRFKRFLVTKISEILSFLPNSELICKLSTEFEPKYAIKSFRAMENHVDLPNAHRRIETPALLKIQTGTIPSISRDINMRVLVMV